jgi:uncharacterized protein YbjT (DUF2867 family)
MVSVKDIGLTVADALIQPPATSPRIIELSGPKQYTSREAAAIRQRPLLDQPAAIGRFDARLRAGSLQNGRLRPINPGTTADLVAAALFVLLRGGWSLDGSAVARNLHATPSDVIAI